MYVAILVRNEGMSRLHQESARMWRSWYVVAAGRAAHAPAALRVVAQAHVLAQRHERARLQALLDVHARSVYLSRERGEAHRAASVGPPRPKTALNSS